MNNQIVCPHCKKSIPLSDAISHEIREEITNKARTQLIEDRRRLQTQFDLDRKKMHDEMTTLEKEKGEKLRKKIEEELALKLVDSKNESEDLKKRNEEQQKQLLDSARTYRELKTQLSQKDLELEKKLLSEQEKIQSEVKKRLEEEYKYKILEKEKQLADTQKALEDARRKSEQVSQQLQGEVLELEIENQLRIKFPFDEIIAVPKGVRGADITHIVKDNRGNSVGIIIWELKRVKNWDNDFVEKIKEDQHKKKAEYAIVISNVLPPSVKLCEYQEAGLWIGNYECVLMLGSMLRNSLLEIFLIKRSNIGKNEKMESLYSYIQGTEFKQRMGAIQDAFRQLQKEIEVERNFFEKKWARQEKNIRKVLDNNFGMLGALESITGKELGDSPELELLPESTSNDLEQEQLL